MKNYRNFIFLLVSLGSAVIMGCQSQSNTLSFSTPSPTVMFNLQNQTAMVSVMSRDLRSSAAVANYTNNGEMHYLVASPDVAQLFQQVMQQNLNSKGFPIIQGAANANVIVNVKEFFAYVEQGNLRYNINAKVGVEVEVQGNKGNYRKTFNATRGYEGVFGVNNQEIQKMLNQTYHHIVEQIYQDNDITNAIHQYK